MKNVLVTALTERKINAEKIRNIFLGLNDGLVEILGAVSGFFGAFGEDHGAGGGLHDRRGRSAFNGCRYLPGSEQREGGQEHRDRQKIFSEKPRK